jgi:maltose O-acetyltransferase
MKEIKRYFSKYDAYHKAQSLWWSVCKDLVHFKLWILGSIPGQLGICLRSRLLTKHFGACGTNAIIDQNFKIDNPKGLFIGDHFRCNAYGYMNAGGIIQIGNYVLIGPSVKIWSINHIFDRCDIPIVEQGWEKKKVVIDDNVWIGANCLILPGVHIKEGSVICGGTVLTKSFPPYSIVAGNPGRLLRTRLSNA